MDRHKTPTLYCRVGGLWLGCARLCGNSGGVKGRGGVKSPICSTTSIRTGFQTGPTEVPSQAMERQVCNGKHNAKVHFVHDQSFVWAKPVRLGPIRVRPWARVGQTASGRIANRSDRPVQGQCRLRADKGAQVGDLKGWGPEGWVMPDFGQFNLCEHHHLTRPFSQCEPLQGILV